MIEKVAEREMDYTTKITFKELEKKIEIIIDGGGKLCYRSGSLRITHLKIA